MPPEGGQPCWHLYFRLLGHRMVGEHSSGFKPLDFGPLPQHPGTLAEIGQVGQGRVSRLL